MFKNILKSISWFSLYLFISFVGFGCGAAILSAIQGMNGKVESALPLDEFNEISMILGLGCVAILGIIAFCLYKVICKHPFDIKRIEFKKSILSIGIGFVFNAILTVLLAIISSSLPEKLIEDLKDSTHTVMEASLPLWIIVVITGILVPIFEEMIFRYGIHGTLARSNVVFAYIVSSLLFGVMHGNVIQGIYTVIFGLICAFLFTKGENLWYGIFAHISLNTSSVIMSEFKEESAWILLGIFIVGLVFIIATRKELSSMFKKKEKTTIEVVL